MQTDPCEATAALCVAYQVLEALLTNPPSSLDNKPCNGLQISLPTMTFSRAGLPKRLGEVSSAGTLITPTNQSCISMQLGNPFDDLLDLTTMLSFTQGPVRRETLAEVAMWLFSWDQAAAKENIDSSIQVGVMFTSGEEVWVNPNCQI